MGDVLSEMTRRQSNAPDPDEQKIKTLTDREHQVIALIAEGLKNKQIAKRLFISETTVTHHLSSIFSKLEVTDRLELVIYAFGHSLARIPK
jgi:DNA-binding NarL/FixJ family response regulator